MQIPDFAVIVLIGVSGSGKSTFARRHFLPTEVLSSDFFRGMVSDDENDQAATKDAFDALHYLMHVRLRRRKSVVIDATNVQPEARKELVNIAKAHDCLCVAMVLNTPEAVCRERNLSRPDRQFGNHVIIRQLTQMRQNIRNLSREGFRYVYPLSEEDRETLVIERVPLWTDRRNEQGPFDLIGDVHGCYTELTELLNTLGYLLNAETGTLFHPEGRRVIFLGDLVDRGPRVVETVNLAMKMCAAGSAFAVPGNHDVKLMRGLSGKQVSVTHGLSASLEQIENLPEDERNVFKTEYVKFADGLVSHLWLDGGKLCAVHAGMPEDYIGRASGRVREFALYGETTGETDEFGLPIRYNWAEHYRGSTSVIYGHTPVPSAEWFNNTLCLDTGCVFGGKLSALRYPEGDLVSVDAKAVYAEPVRPLVPEKVGESSAELSLQWRHDDLLNAEDVLGKRFIETSLMKTVTVPAEHAAAALEVMSRFATDPRWLMYLPPTMSPCETAPSDTDLLERPHEAFNYYRTNGASQVVCQRKHMGSRSVVIVCKDREAARSRFGSEGETGQVLTRTGRPFFDSIEMSEDFLQELRNALTKADFWNEFATDWVLLDCELMPWNAKAQGLLKEQYAPVGSAATLALTEAKSLLELAEKRGLALSDVRERAQTRLADTERYRAAYAHYCWNVSSLNDLRLAPFHLLATEGNSYFDRDHLWHIETLERLSAHSDLLLSTERKIVTLSDEASCNEATAWWETLTASGGEGMVVKPLDFVVRGNEGLLQPAVKVRGREYLRIIYGAEYTEPQHLTRLRSRALGGKRGLALREFALGVEGIERFLRKEPLRRVHECVFGVLALESEPVDPRL